MLHFLNYVKLFLPVATYGIWSLRLFNWNLVKFMLGWKQLMLLIQISLEQVKHISINIFLGFCLHRVWLTVGSGSQISPPSNSWPHLLGHYLPYKAFLKSSFCKYLSLLRLTGNTAKVITGKTAKIHLSWGIWLRTLCHSQKKREKRPRARWIRTRYL